MSATAAIIGSVVGGLSRRREAKQANKQAQDQYNQNIALQKEFAQNGIRWKVADAKAAGLHPLAALGASTATYSPVSSTFTPSGLGDTYERMGQDVSQAMMAQASKAERAEEAAKMQAYNDAQLKLQTENMGLQNDLIRTQINTYKMQQLGALDRAVGMPSNVFRSGVGSGGDLPGQNVVVPRDMVAPTPSEQISSQSGDLNVQAGKKPAWIQLQNGAWILDSNLMEEQPWPVVYGMYADFYGRKIYEALKGKGLKPHSFVPRGNKE